MFRISLLPKFNLVFCVQIELFHKNALVTFWAILLTNRQTNTVKT